MYGAGLCLLRFFFLLKRIIILTVLLWKQLFQILRRLAGNVLNGNALAETGGADGVERSEKCSVSRIFSLLLHARHKERAERVADETNHDHGEQGEHAAPDEHILRRRPAGADGDRIDRGLPRGRHVADRSAHADDAEPRGHIDRTGGKRQKDGERHGADNVRRDDV